MSWYLEVLKKYAVFSGRAWRKVYWFFALFNVIIIIGLTVVDLGAGTYDSAHDIGLLGGIYSLAILVPNLAVSVRRLHDTDRTGRWLLIGLIPLIGAIIIQVFTVLDGDPDTNTYGPNPKLALG